MKGCNLVFTDLKRPQKLILDDIFHDPANKDSTVRDLILYHEIVRTVNNNSEVTLVNSGVILL